MGHVRIVPLLAIVAVAFATPNRAKANCSEMGVALTISGKVGEVDRDGHDYIVEVRDQNSGDCEVGYLQIEGEMPASCVRGITFHASGSFFKEVLLVKNMTCP